MFGLSKNSVQQREQGSVRMSHSVHTGAKFLCRRQIPASRFCSETDDTLILTTQNRLLQLQTKLGLFLFLHGLLSAKKNSA